MPFIETADRASLFVTEWGSGPRVVFTHAWGLRSDQWDYQVPALAAAGMRCVLYERRGHGRRGTRCGHVPGTFTRLGLPKGRSHDRGS